MKNITVLAVLVIILNAYSYAGENEKTYCFLLDPQFGFVYGQAMEYVYPLPGQTKNELLSELLWDMKPIFYFGVQAQFSRIDLMSKPGFFSSLSFKAGIPAESGVMEDRDWRSTENDSLTDFSSHTNRTSEFFWLDAAVGASIPIKSLLYIKPFIGGSWMRFVFIGRDGYGTYARSKGFGTFYPIDDNPIEKSYKGQKVIRYEQDWLLLAAGLSAGTEIFSPFSFELSFQISPFTYCAATDNHFTTKTVYRDFTGWGLFLEPSLDISFSAGALEFSLKFTYRHIGKTKGESYSNMNDTWFFLEPNEGGAGLSVLDSRFLFSIRL
ncbi:MAG: omptin family outer membrane protease [Treponema sp.]|jgi:outer membrane protease|nr:omptin family outer membrane protease [Treponema sp.]